MFGSGELRRHHGIGDIEWSFTDIDCDEQGCYGAREGKKDLGTEGPKFICTSPCCQPSSLIRSHSFVFPNYMADDIFQPCSAQCILDRYEQDEYKECTLI